MVIWILSSPSSSSSELSSLLESTMRGALRFDFDEEVRSTARCAVPRSVSGPESDRVKSMAVPLLRQLPPPDMLLRVVRYTRRSKISSSEGPPTRYTSTRRSAQAKR